MQILGHDTTNGVIMFTACINGHDLTGPDAYIYRGGGLRECRQCVEAKANKRAKGGKVSGSSGMGWAY